MKDLDAQFDPRVSQMDILMDPYLGCMIETRVWSKGTP